MVVKIKNDSKKPKARTQEDVLTSVKKFVEDNTVINYEENIFKGVSKFDVVKQTGAHLYTAEKYLEVLTRLRVIGKMKSSFGKFALYFGNNKSIKLKEVENS